jgi:hypothetical protein
MNGQQKLSLLQSKLNKQITRVRMSPPLPLVAGPFGPEFDSRRLHHAIVLQISCR